MRRRSSPTKENFSDAIAGVALPSDSDEVVANILIDLAQRETQNRSTVFARSIVGELAGNLHTQKLRSAGFRVLKAPDMPSVLLELGFLSNPDDEKHLVSDAWRDTHERLGRRCDRQLFRQTHRPHPVLSPHVQSCHSAKIDDFPPAPAFCCHNLR